MDLKEQIISVLQQCYDPELPVDLWNLGLIYEIGLQEDEKGNADVNITMSLTTPGCGMGQHMANDIKEKVSGLDGVENVNVNVTFDPPWNPEMITEDGKKLLGLD